MSRIVTVISIALYDIDRDAGLLNDIADAVFDLCAARNSPRPVITSETNLVNPSLAGERQTS